jgi:hypothetical protein
MADGRVDSMSLVKLIVAGALFGFYWQGELWIPMFQFHPDGMSVRSGLTAVLAELESTHDGWALAGWFLCPSPWLCGRKPIDVIQKDGPSVLAAARIDRYIAYG